MANPSPYIIAYSFSGFQANNPATPLPAPALDGELSNVSTSIASIISALASVRRSDGFLNNGLVSYDSLAPALQTAGIAPANAWVTGTVYALNMSAIQAGVLYRCLVPHTAGVFATDLAAGYWLLVANLATAFAAGTNLQLVGSVFSVVPSPAFTAPTAQTAAAGTNSTQLATTAYLDSKLGVASGIATLDGAGKLTAAQIPAALVGAVVYQGTWNASTNTPALASGIGAKGNYYKVSVAGATTIDGINQWGVGDTIIFDGTTWDKIDGVANEVLTVAGRFGNVTLAFTDISGQATLAQLPTLAANTVLGSIAGGTPIALSTAQHTSLVNAFTTTLSGAVPAPGTVTGKVLSDSGWSAAAAAGVASLNSATGAISLSVVIQKFTASGTYTPTTGMKYCTIECVGGGGGGGGVAGTSGQTGGAGGGGGGSYSRLVASAATIGASKTVTIGVGGTGATAGNNAGGAGGDTSLGVLCVGKGGSGGGGTPTGGAGIGGAGGVAGTGDASFPGQPGSGGIGAVITTVTVLGGAGGSSHMGAGAGFTLAQSAGVFTGGAGGNYGGGGAGGGAYNSASNAAGGAGAGGYVLVTEFVIA